VIKSKSIIFAGYRDWALEIFNKLEKKYSNINWYLANNPEKLNDLYQIKNIEIVILAGWSWILPEDQINNKLVVGLHPSDLPNYAGGSPIQNQVLDGLTSTKMTMFKLEKRIDSGEWLYKNNLSLQGSIQDIFKEMVRSSMEIIGDFIEDYPQLTFINQTGNGKKCRRLSPNQSVLNKAQMNNMSTYSLYNFIRCRQDPYPNACLEDEFGKLIFKNVEYEQRKN